MVLLPGSTAFRGTAGQSALLIAEALTAIIRAEGNVLDLLAWRRVEQCSELKCLLHYAALSALRTYRQSI